MKTTLKYLTITLLSALLMSSCVYHSDTERTYDGRAFLSIYDGGTRAPSFIDTYGLLPNNFYYGTYYEVYPGKYTIYYEYEWNNGYSIIIDPFEAYIEIWINYASSRRDGADNYFNLDLYPDGVSDYYLKNSNTSSFKTNDIVKVIEKEENNYGFTVTIKKVEPRKH